MSTPPSKRCKLTDLSYIKNSTTKQEFKDKCYELAHKKYDDFQDDKERMDYIMNRDLFNVSSADQQYYAYESDLFRELGVPIPQCVDEEEDEDDEGDGEDEEYKCSESESSESDDDSEYEESEHEDDSDYDSEEEEEESS